MSTLHVENLKGLSSGGNANKIIVPSGQTLTAPGHVIQVQRSSISGNITTSSVNASATGLECAITPKFATSLLKIELVGGRHYMTNSQLDIHLYKDGSTVNSVGNGRWISIYNNEPIHNGGYSACHFETASSTNARTYQVYFDGHTTFPVYFNNSPSGNNEYLVHLVVTEIAQ